MNWKNIIADIQSHGKLTRPQIATECGCGVTTVNDLATGATLQPRHSLGVQLLEILERVKPELAHAPVNTAQAATQTIAMGVTNV